MKNEFSIIRSDKVNYLCRKKGSTYYYVSNPMTNFTEGEDDFEIITPDPAYLKKTYKYGDREVRVLPTFYQNGWLAISIKNPKRSNDNDIITVNLETSPAIGIPSNTFVDINNHPKVLKFLTNNKLVKDAGYKRQSGFVMYPMVFVDLVLLYQHDPKAFKNANQ